MRAPLLLACAFAVACSSGKHSYPPYPQPSNALVTARHYDSMAPAGWHNETPLPLLILLHGYGTIGYSQAAYLGFTNLPDDHQALLAFPDGTIDSSGAHFWNATDACCNFDGSSVDDVAYLNAVIDDMEANYNVDRKRIYFAGHSNGGFMSHRMACDAADRIAGIAALAGDVWKDPSKCNPSRPVPVLQIHGDMDDMVPYAGKANEPSAPESVATWAAKDGCTGGLTATGKPALDLAIDVPGAETKSEAWSCPKGAAAELWTMQGAGHMPMVAMSKDSRGAGFDDLVWAWLTQFSR